MSSLADDFLNDIDYDEPETGNDDTNAEDSSPFSALNDAHSTTARTQGGEGDIDMDDFEDDEGEGVEDMQTEADSALEAMMREVGSAKNARDIAKLMDSEEMKGIMKVTIEKRSLSAGFFFYSVPFDTLTIC